MDLKKELELMIESGKIRLPVLPKVAAKVLNIINDPKANLNELSTLIQQDQAIATHVLRIANSAAFAPTTEIVSINQAIARLGFRLLSEITLTISLQSDIFNSKKFHHEMISLWKFSLLSGLWAKRIAFIKKYNVEATFLGALLHEIGKAIIINSLNDIIKNEHYHIEKTDLEELLNEYHISVARKVMKEWNLPKLVSSISCDYINLEQCTINKKEACIVFLADKLAFASIHNLDFDEILKLEQWQIINYYQDEVMDLINEKDIILETMSSMTI